MADIENITGWREELKEFYESDEGYEFFNGRSLEISIKLSDIFELAELFIKYDCLREAAEKVGQWREVTLAQLENMPGNYQENFERLLPREAVETCADFENWFAMRKKIQADQLVVDLSLRIVTAYLRGEADSVRTIDGVRNLAAVHERRIINDVGD